MNLGVIKYNCSFQVDSLSLHMASTRNLWYFYVLVTEGFMYGCSGFVTLSSDPVDHWEKTEVTLTCSYVGQYTGTFRWILNNTLYGEKSSSATNCRVETWLANTTKYLYNCSNDKIHSVTIKNITQDMHGETWRCEFNPGAFTYESEILQIYVKVPVKSSTLRPSMDILTIPENSTFTWQCTTYNSRPEPRFVWYIQSSTDSDGEKVIMLEDYPDISSASTAQSYTSSYSVILNRTLNRWYLFCGAQNRNESIVLSRYVLLNITYPPDGPPRIAKFEKASEINVVMGDFLNLECLLTGGNPRPRLVWNKINNMIEEVSGNLVKLSISWQANKLGTEEMICQSIQQHENCSTFVTVNVLYPPHRVDFTLKNLFGIWVNVTNSISVIENRSLYISCSADSKPPVSKTEWNGLLLSDGSSLNITNIRRDQAGALMCKVFNTMVSTDSNRTVTGSNSSVLQVDILYPPRVNQLKDKIIAEGDDLVYACDVIDGNPNSNEFKWARGDDTWDGQLLTLADVSRNQSGIYTCTVQNTMTATDGDIANGSDSGFMNIIVQYKTKIKRLVVKGYDLEDSITVDENDNVTSVCEIEGNPLPQVEMFLQVSNQFQRQTTQLKLPAIVTKSSYSLHIETVFEAHCTRSGILTCTGKNTMNNGLQSITTKYINFHVTCPPRKSPFHEFPQSDIVESSTSVQITLNFTTLSYPLPPVLGYIWSRKTDSTRQTWTTINKSDTTFLISTFGLQSNLTIRSVTRSDYGLYRVNVDNGIGEFDYTFILTATDQLEKPSRDSLVGAISGGASASLVVVVVVSCLVILYRKRSRVKKPRKENGGCEKDKENLSLVFGEDQGISTRG